MEAQKLATTPWDAADYIDTPEDVVEFLKAALEENDAGLLIEAIDIVSRAKGTALLAQRAGVPLDDLLRHSADGGSDVATLLRLDVRAKADPEPV